MKIKEFIIMPQTIEPQGLIHLPGTGPNNRFDFKNKGNNRANETLENKFQSALNAEPVQPKREWTAFEMACMEGGHPLPEDAAGVGIITKQNTTQDVKPGDEYKNVKKLHLEFKDFIENFDDGKNPGRKGLSKRVGIPKKATLSQLSKIAKNSTGERRRMAQWQLNMRRGRMKAK